MSTKQNWEPYQVGTTRATDLCPVCAEPRDSHGATQRCRTNFHTKPEKVKPIGVSPYHTPLFSDEQLAL